MGGSRAKSQNAQSAMEYLMTYGWAILIIAVVLAVLYQLGVFSGTSFATTGCIAEVGFLCTSPAMNTLGYLSVNIGQIGQGSVTVTGVNCTGNSAAPSSFQSESLALASSQVSSVTFQCPLKTQQIGGYFTGYLWVKYTNAESQTIITQMGTITAEASTSSGLGSSGPSSPSSVYLYCVGEVFSSQTNYAYSAQIYSNGILASWQSTNNLPGYDPSYQDCGISGSDIYCNGYSFNYASSVASTEYSPISGGQILNWQSTSAPLVSYNNNVGSVNTNSCFVYNGDFYCIAGSPQEGNPGDSSAEFTTLSSGGAGSWSYTAANYVTDASYIGCAAGSNGYAYCVGGYTSQAPEDDRIYAGQIAGSGTTFSMVGTYPIGMQIASCVSTGGYLYCMGDGNPSSSAVYSIPIESNGALGNSGNWASQPSLSTDGADTCTYYNGQIYCTVPGGTTYNAVITSPGTLSNWGTDPSFPGGSLPDCAVGN